METWELRPNVSVGSVVFGVDRTEAHALLGEDYEELKKTEWRKTTTEDYLRFHVIYTPDDRVEAIRFFHGEGIEITLDGVVIFPMRRDMVKEVVPGIKSDEFDFFWDEERSIVYGQYAGEEDEMFDFIMVGMKGSTSATIGDGS